MPSFSLCLLNKNFSYLIFELKPLISSNKSLNKTLMLDLLVSNQTKGYFESIISILQLLIYP